MHPHLQLGAEHGKQWSTSVTAPSFCVNLMYPREAGCSSQHYAPRLVAEVLELEVHAEASGPALEGWAGLERLS